tara:strand:+ start:1413 stop:1889 length:477 start_codon:yes stop_codon:yes gene_type:complete
MQHTISHIYKDFADSDAAGISKNTFVSVCSDFNIMIIDRLLEGKEFNMGHNLSTLSIVRKLRDPRSPSIDWGESNKYKQELLDAGTPLFNKETGEGVKWHIYYTDGEYLKYYWRKGKCKVKNKTAYRFDATRGIKGNKGKLKQIGELDYLNFRLDTYQ